MGNLGLEIQIGVCVVAVLRWKRAAKGHKRYPTRSF